MVKGICLYVFQFHKVNYQMDQIQQCIEQLHLVFVGTEDYQI